MLAFTAATSMVAGTRGMPAFLFSKKNVFQIQSICLLAQSDVRGEVWSDNKYEPDDEIKRKCEDPVGEQTLEREDKDISYAKLTHNVVCDSGGCRPSHTQRGFWDGRVRGSGKRKGGGRVNRGLPRLLLTLIGARRFDSIDPGPRHIPRDTKQIWASG